MTNEAQRITIAEACGWTEITHTGFSDQGIRPKRKEGEPRYGSLYRPAPSPVENDRREWHWIPDYLNDLNAMHEAEKVLTEDQGGEFEEILERICQDQLELDGTNHWLRFRVAHATAAQRAEAFLKTLNLWEDQ